MLLRQWRIMPLLDARRKDAFAPSATCGCRNHASAPARIQGPQSTATPPPLRLLAGCRRA